MDEEVRVRERRKRRIPVAAVLLGSITMAVAWVMSSPASESLVVKVLSSQGWRDYHFWSMGLIGWMLAFCAWGRQFKPCFDRLMRICLWGNAGMWILVMIPFLSVLGTSRNLMVAIGGCSIACSVMLATRRYIG